MNGKRIFRIVGLTSLFWIALYSIGRAETPWSRLMSGKRIEADPAKDYQLKEENGPWIIMVCSFSGDGSDKQAHDLVLELRSKYRLPAFIHKWSQTLDDPNAASVSLSAAPRRHEYQRFADRKDRKKDHEIHEIAVVVGDFPAVDDPEAQRVLEKIKSSEPDCMNLKQVKTESSTLGALRYMQNQVQNLLPQNVESRKHRGPLAHAFITTNPLLPSEYFVPKGGIDELVLRMNEGVTHSLLDCPGKYTVQVAHFTGEITINQAEIQAIQSGVSTGHENGKDSLADAAMKAHRLTEALREKGYEAYEFHDRYASIVTIGSFDSVNDPMVHRTDGKTEINPRVYAIMKLCGGEAVNVPGETGAMTVKSLVGINFDMQAIPVEVPKRSISRELVRRLSTNE